MLHVPPPSPATDADLLPMGLEIEAELARLRARFPANPDLEMHQLLLVALEREEIVAVAYRDSLMIERLHQMKLPADIEHLIKHGLLWAWKDEEMHSIYVRGALLDRGTSLQSAQTYMHQLAGAVGGWSTSITQHVSWGDAPLARLTATSITRIGQVLGQVPRSVGRHMRLLSFRDFCLFNVEAEQTAWLCWRRLAELAATHPEPAPTAPPTAPDSESSPSPTPLLRSFERIVEDEDMHRRLFELLARCFDDQNRLRPDVTSTSLKSELRLIGEWFLPPEDRSTSPRTGSMGRGGPVHVIQGTGLPSKIASFNTLLDDVGLPALVVETAHRLERPPSTLRVVIKPSFMLGYSKGDLSPVTDPELLAALVERLSDLGVRDIALLETPNIYSDFYSNRSVAQVAAYYGIDRLGARIVDSSTEQIPHQYSRGLGQHRVARSWKEADLRIGFSRLRSHPVYGVHLNVGNLEAVGSLAHDFLFVERRAHRETAIAMLANEFPPDLVLLDAYQNCPDGMAGIMGCRNPRSPCRLYAGRDALAVDLVAARHVGLLAPEASPVFQTALQWFGDPRAMTTVIGIDEAIPSWRGPYHDAKSRFLSFLAYPVFQFASGRGSMFTPAMDPIAFPPLSHENVVQRIGRAFTRWLLDLPRP